MQDQNSLSHRKGQSYLLVLCTGQYLTFSVLMEFLTVLCWKNGMNWQFWGKTLKEDLNGVDAILQWGWCQINKSELLSICESSKFQISYIKLIQQAIYWTWWLITHLARHMCLSLNSYHLLSMTFIYSLFAPTGLSPHHPTVFSLFII